MVFGRGSGKARLRMKSEVQHGQTCLAVPLVVGLSRRCMLPGPEGSGSSAWESDAMRRLPGGKIAGIIRYEALTYLGELL